MIRTLVAALAGHWRRHPLELVTLLVGLATATALWSGVQAINAQARASYAAAASVLGGDGARVTARDGQPFPRADYVALRRAGWKVSPVLEGDWRPPDGGDLAVRLIGIDPVTLPRGAGPLAAITDPGANDPAALPDFVLPPGRAYANPETVALLADRTDLPPRIAAPNLPPDTLLLDIGAAERLLDRPGRVSALLLPAPAGPLPPDIARRLEITTPGGGDLARLTDSFHLNLTAFGFLSFFVGLFIVYSAMGLAFERRRPMLRTLRACGVPAATLTATLLTETLLIGLAGGALGLLGGRALAAVLLPDVAASLDGLYGARVPAELALSPAWWLAGLAVATLGALAAAAGTLVQAARLPLLDTARPEAWRAAAARRLRWQAVAALLAAAAAALALVFGSGLAAGFATMGALLLCAALLLPGALSLALSLLARRACGPVAQWLWADARQRLGGLSLALMALMLALGVNVGVGAMVESFRGTFLGWLDQRLAAELYLTAADTPDQRAIAAWLATRPEVSAILPIGAAETRFAGAPLSVYGYTDDPIYRDRWPLLAALPDPWDRAAGGAVLISEQLSHRAGLAPGDAIEIPGPTGPWSTTVAAIYSDYGNPDAQILAPLPAVAAHWPEAEIRRLALRVDPARTAALAAELRARFGAEVADQRAIKSVALATFERTFAITLALNALTLAVAGVALLASLLTLADQRLGQLAPLWALGLTRSRLAAIELAQALLLAALTALAALPLGLAIAHVLTDIINVRAFGWRLPVLLFPLDWLRLVALALATGALAALWPALRLARAAPATLLRRFSDER